ncbi:MAG: acetyl-CoA hydrolase/transferase family protein [Myxococcaceae bacterium]|nr:acetyl-CoA hydrolase/transferase family protein [Myxococcaceae bacterium]MCA3016184.1 acetyl-CoA hydrolase/transferase family protein [Myxococcaceae bacterium]
MTADDAVRLIHSHSRVFVQGAAATPTLLLEALARRGSEFEGVETVHLHLDGNAPHARPELARSFRPNAFFCGDNLRTAVAEGRADYMPVFLSEIPLLFRNGVLPLDAALLHVSPPDAHGYVSLGTSVDTALAAAQTAKTLIAQVNRQMPRSLGDGAVHVSRFAALVECDVPLPEHAPAPAGPVEEAIAQRIAGLVENGATLQMGIGAIPDAVLRALTHHRGLGVHTKMFSDGLLPLLEKGVVTNEFKRRQRGKTVSSFVNGTRRLYDFIHDNPAVELRDCAYVNDTSIIREQPKMTAINSAIEVDLTGQVVADSIGERSYSGVGGQMDFIRGATLSDEGKAIIALPSSTSKGDSRIVAQLKPGAGVVTTRAHVRFVVTEHGVADLYGKNLRQRAQALIAIAAPAARDELEQAARRRFHA